MCYLVLHHRVRADTPLLLMANRDESYDRPFVAPRWLEARPDVFAPRDETGGGTWLGVSRAGLVAAITNRGRPLRDVTLRSRGQLVLDALAQPDVPSAVIWLREHLATQAYEGFHLLLADRDEAQVVRHVASPDPHAPRADDIVVWTGASQALSNLHEVGALDVPQGARPRGAERLSAWIDRHETLSRDDQTPLPDGHRILKRGHGRGTVCSAIVALRGDGEPPVFRFADGPPDRAPFQDAWAPR